MNTETQDRLTTGKATGSVHTRTGPYLCWKVGSGKVFSARCYLATIPVRESPLECSPVYEPVETATIRSFLRMRTNE